MKGWHKAAIATLAALLLLKEKTDEIRDDLSGDVLDQATVIIRGRWGSRLSPVFPKEERAKWEP